MFAESVSSSAVATRTVRRTSEDPPAGSSSGRHHLSHDRAGAAATAREAESLGAAAMVLQLDLGDERGRGYLDVLRGQPPRDTRSPVCSRLCCSPTRGGRPARAPTAPW